jgi:hypothetical protein
MPKYERTRTNQYNYNEINTMRSIGVFGDTKKMPETRKIKRKSIGLSKGVFDYWIV